MDTKTAEIIEGIRADYAEHAAHIGETSPWVSIADLRESTITARYRRDAVDAALLVLIDEPDVRIQPESIRCILTRRERRAAVEIGGEDRHKMCIG